MDVLKVTGYHRRPPHLIADKRGFFSREGLGVVFHKATYAPDHNQGMAEGHWDFTLSSADTMIARATTDGVDYLLFMQAEEGLDAYLIGRPGINSIEDLRGKPLAGDPGDSNLDLIRKKILKQHGIEDKEYTVEIIGASPQRLKAFKQGRVVAAMLTPPSSEEAIAVGGKILARAADYVSNWPLTCGWTQRVWLETHRDLVVRFIRAWVDATDWILNPANREATLGLLVTELGLTPAAAKNSLDQIVPKAQINPTSIRRVLELRIAMDLYRPPFSPAERFYDASYWHTATGLPVPKPAGMPAIQVGVQEAKVLP